METQNRDLGFAGDDRSPLPNGQPTTEFKKLLVETIFSLRLSVERENASRGAACLNFSNHHTDDGRSTPCITGLENSFSLNWRLPGVDSLEDSALEATIWSGGPPSLGYSAFEKPRPQTSRAVHLGYSIANGYVWMDADGPDEFSPQALAEDLIAWYLDNGR